MVVKYKSWVSSEEEGHDRIDVVAEASGGLGGARLGRDKGCHGVHVRGGDISWKGKWG